MAEYFLGSRDGQDTIRQELATYRQSPGRFVKEQHPRLSFVTLSALAHDPLYASLVCQPFLRAAIEVLAFRFFRLAGCSLLDPERVWIGVAASAEMGFFGGFYHADQGYRYLQQIAITSLSGALSRHPVDHILRTLELLRAYAHDTLHYQSYRLFCSMSAPTSGPLGFYRLQYGINFRRWNGQSYSARDSVRSPTTRNLGYIMEAATDRFAQEWVLFLAESVGYRPCEGTFEEYVYRDCTGQLTEEHVRSLQMIEQGLSVVDFSAAVKAYLKSMRLFAQYVTMRYRAFLAAYDVLHREELHVQILQGMLSGKLSDLCYLLDMLEGNSRSFVALFKTPEY